LLHEVTQGNKAAQDELIPLVYKELHRIAQIHLRRENVSHSLQPTALVNEAYLRFVNVQEISWQGRSHFFAFAANIMRRILVDHARARKANKRGQGFTRVEFNEAFLPARSESTPDILELDYALEQLAKLDLRQSKIVEMRFFAGMNEEETALALGISARTVKRDWRVAKAWLYKELS
jgi:RNA polymerase sigma factor (TIGR02999 family)